MMMTRLGLSLVLLLVGRVQASPSGPPVAVPAAEEKKAPALQLLPIPAPHWPAQQFLQADLKGRVFLLRGDTLEVYPLLAGGVGEPVKLEAAADAQETHEVSFAAMSLDGSRWALLRAKQVLLFEDSKQHTLPEVGWFPNSLGFVRDQPVVGVYPIGSAARIGDGKVVPQVLAYDGEDWKTFIERASLAKAHQQDADPFNTAFANNLVALAGDSKGKLWVLYPAAGRIARYTGAGRSEEVIVFGEGVPRYHDKEEAVRRDAEVRKTIRIEGRSATGERGKTTVGALTFKTAIHALAVTHDGTVYFVLDPSVGSASPLLGRYDGASEESVQVTPLALVLDGGTIDMAAGADGLYFAPRNASKERFWLPWQRVESAYWKDFPVTVSSRE